LLEKFLCPHVDGKPDKLAKKGEIDNGDHLSVEVMK
jgi:hypothetical protein